MSLACARSTDNKRPARGGFDVSTNSAKVRGDCPEKVLCSTQDDFRRRTKSAVSLGLLTCGGRFERTTFGLRAQRATRPRHPTARNVLILVSDCSAARESLISARQQIGADADWLKRVEMRPPSDARYRDRLSCEVARSSSRVHFSGSAGSPIREVVCTAVYERCTPPGRDAMIGLFERIAGPL